MCEGGPRLLRSILAATCPHGCLQAHPRCLHLGRYGPEGHLCHDTETAFVRTWKPGLSICHWYLAPTCSVPVTLEEHKKIWSFLGDDDADFCDLVSGSHLFGVRQWSTGSWTFLGDDFWMFSVSSSCWCNTGFMLRQFTEAFWVSTAENCGVSAVAVHRWSSNFLSWCTGRFPWSCCSADHRYSTVVLERGDRCPCCAKSFTCPLCATTGALICVAHQQCRLHLVVPQRLIPMVLFVQIIIEIPLLLVDAVADVPVVRVVQVLTGRL